MPPVDPDTEYYVWILPYNENVPMEEYTFKDLLIYTCATEPLAYNSAITATTVVDSVKFNAVYYTVTPPTGGKTAYEVIEKAEFDSLYVVDGVVDPELLAEYMKLNWATEEKAVEAQTWSIEEKTSYVLALYNVVAGEYSVQTVNFTTPSEVVLPSPLNKQWMFESELIDTMVIGMPMGAQYCFDLGVAFPTTYPEIFSDPTTTVLAIDYGSIPETEAPEGSWFPAFAGYGSASVVPDDETSGVITWLGEYVIPYSDYDGDTCTFDFGFLLEMFEMEGEFVVESTLAEEFVPVQAQ